MGYDPEKHHRRSIRLPGHDYRDGGAYFITICTRDRACVFGEIREGAFHPSRRGLVARECWHDIPNHRAYVALDEFVVMPNHVHGVFWIDHVVDARATQVSPLPERPKSIPGSVGAIVGSYKAAVSRTINELHAGAGTDLWQPNFYEHIVRCDSSLGMIREYITTNLQRWEMDRENPLGNGTDDVEAFIRALDVFKRRKEGDTSVAPTGAE